MKPFQSLQIRFFAFALCAAWAATCFAQRPELVVQRGHSTFSHIRSIAFSPDGKTLASGGEDNQVILWDVATGRELRTLLGHSNYVGFLAFSGDGRTLVSGAGELIFRDVITGRDLRRLEEGGPRAVSPDGRILATGSGEIKLYDLATGEKLRAFAESGHYCQTLAFSPDGKTLTCGSGHNDGVIELWDVASGTMRRSIASGHTQRVTALTFDPAGVVLMSGSDDGTIRFHDVTTGRQVRSFTADKFGASFAALSPDGRLLASASAEGTQLWDAADGRVLRKFNQGFRPAQLVAFSPDGRTLAAVDNAIRLYDVRTGQELRALAGRSSSVEAVAFNPDGQTLASGFGPADAVIKLWNTGAGRELRTLKGFSAGSTAITFSPDGKTLAGAGEIIDKTVRLWDVQSGREFRAFAGHQGWIKSAAFSPDGSILATAAISDNDKAVRLWDVATGKLLRTLAGHSDRVVQAAFSPDGKIIASAGVDGSGATIKLWDVRSGAQIRLLQEVGEPLAFSPDGKLLAGVAGSNNIKIFDTATGAELRALQKSLAQIETIAFSPDSRILASGGWDGVITVWDVSGGAEPRTMTGHTNVVNSVAFSPDGRFLASGSRDTRTTLWDVAAGRELASLIAIDKADWIVVTPEGLFDGSPAAWGSILWRFAENTFDVAPVEAFFNEFYYPGLLGDILSGKKISAARDIQQLDRRQPGVKLSLADKQAATGVATRNVTVRVDVAEAPPDKGHPAGSGARDVRLFRNGSLVRVWRGDVVPGGGKTILEASVPVVAGENLLTAYAFNRDNVKSADATLQLDGAASLKRAGTAYIVVAGVNQYANPQFNLRYAVPDAVDFGEELKAQQTRLGAFGRIEVVPLLDEQATGANLLAALHRLAGEETRSVPEGAPAALQRLARAEPEDAVIIYFAGHGTAAGNQFYLVPHDLGYEGPRERLDASGLQAILTHSISDRELEQALEKVDAGRLLLVIDACNSGQALEAEEKRRGPMNSRGLAQLAYEKGMYILTAAQAYQAALEASQLGHGYLTYALVEEALKTGAVMTAAAGNTLTVREWMEYAAERVPQMQQERLKQSRLLTQQGGGKGQQDVQRPRVFYRRELEARPFTVARKGVK